MNELYCLDTNTVSEIMKKNQTVLKNLKEKTNEGAQYTISPLTYYEIVRGLIAVNGHKKLMLFKQLYEKQSIKLQMNEEFLMKAAEIHAGLKKSGNLIEDLDIFIGAISLVNKCTLVTNNTKHMNRIKGLKIVDFKQNTINDIT